MRGAGISKKLCGLVVAAGVTVTTLSVAKAAAVDYPIPNGLKLRKVRSLSSCDLVCGDVRIETGALPACWVVCRQDKQWVVSYRPQLYDGKKYRAVVRDVDVYGVERLSEKRLKLVEKVEKSSMVVFSGPASSRVTLVVWGVPGDGAAADLLRKLKEHQDDLKATVAFVPVAVDRGSVYLAVLTKCLAKQVGSDAVWQFLISGKLPDKAKDVPCKLSDEERKAVVESGMPVFLGAVKFLPAVHLKGSSAIVYGRVPVEAVKKLINMEVQ